MSYSNWESDKVYRDISGRKYRKPDEPNEPQKPVKQNNARRLERRHIAFIIASFFDVQVASFILILVWWSDSSDELFIRLFLTFCVIVLAELVVVKTALALEVFRS